MRYTLGFLAAALLTFQSAAFADDPSCQRVGPLAECAYAVSPAGTGQMSASITVDQPMNTVLHAQPGGPLVSFKGANHANFASVMLRSDSAATLYSGKGIFKVKYPVEANVSYPAAAQITVNQRLYYLLNLKNQIPTAAVYFLVDAQTGAVFDQFASLTSGYTSGMVSLSFKGMASEDPAGLKFNMESKQRSSDSAAVTHALVFDRVFGISLQLQDQTVDSTGHISTTPFNTVAQPGVPFTWQGVTIQIVSQSSQDIAYKIIGVQQGQQQL